MVSCQITQLTPHCGPYHWEDDAMLEQMFALRTRGATVGTEILAGVTTFMVMLRHEVARLIVWRPMTRPVVPSTVSYVVRQQGNELSKAHEHRTRSRTTDTQTARGRCLC